jgi:transcriptional regulator with XRE-family HTH domain
MKRPRAFRSIEAENFELLRVTHRLSVKDASELLHVSERTVLNWESGRARIPYTAYRLLRVLRNHELPHDAWDGWRLSGDTLYSPTNRPFKPYELLYISHYFTMARYWLKDSATRNRQAKITALRRQSLTGGHLRLVASGGHP